MRTATVTRRRLRRRRKTNNEKGDAAQQHRAARRSHSDVRSIIFCLKRWQALLTRARFTTQGDGHGGEPLPGDQLQSEQLETRDGQDGRIGDQLQS